MRDIIIHPDVAKALQQGLPVVALESAVITAGLPTSVHKLASAAAVDGWHDDEPANIEAARAMLRAVRGADAVPAITSILGGDIYIGLQEEELPRLVAHAHGAKATTRDFGVLMAKGKCAGTTVAGTLRAASLANDTDLRVMATGGIGGVHHTWPAVPDVSADLYELANTPMCVVCSGPKSVLNVHATLELLEALGIPVIGYGTEKLPAFYLRELGDLRCQARADTPEEVAEICAAHWDSAHSRTGVLIAQPVAEEVALDHAVLDEAMRAATDAARAAGTTGADVTPFLLRELAQRTNGRSLDANVNLLVRNAQLAGQIAVALQRK